MGQFAVALFLLSCFFLFSCLLSIHIDGVDVLLEKLPSGAEFKYQYKLENGTTYRGESVTVNGVFYLVFGANGDIFEFTLYNPEKELHSTSPTHKFAALVKRSGDRFEYATDSTSYVLDISDEPTLRVIPYATKRWDTNNICFKKSKENNNTFTFSVESLNNARVWTGNTVYENNDPLVQLIYQDDWLTIPCMAKYSFNFTEADLSTTETFCKPAGQIDTIQYCPFGATVTSDINANVIKSLVG